MEKMTIKNLYLINGLFGQISVSAIISTTKDIRETRAPKVHKSLLIGCKFMTKKNKPPVKTEGLRCFGGVGENRTLVQTSN